VVGIAAHAVDHCRRHRVEEMQPDEVEPGLVPDDAAIVPRLAVAVEHRKIDP